MLKHFRLSIAKYNTLQRAKRETEQLYNDADDSESLLTASNDERKQKNKLPCEVSILNYILLLF